MKKSLNITSFQLFLFTILNFITVFYSIPVKIITYFVIKSVHYNIDIRTKLLPRDFCATYVGFWLAPSIEIKGTIPIFRQGCVLKIRLEARTRFKILTSLHL